MTTFHGLLKLLTVVGDVQVHNPKHLEFRQDKTSRFSVHLKGRT